MKAQKFRNYIVMNAYGSKKSEAGELIVFDTDKAYRAFIDSYLNGEFDDQGVFSIRLDRVKIGQPVAPKTKSTKKVAK